MIISVGAVVILFSTIGLTLFIVSLLGIDVKGVSLIWFARTLLLIASLVAAVPTAIFGEYLNKQWKGREFLWRSALGGIAVFGLFLVITVLMLTLFEEVFSRIDIVWQIPLIAVSNSLGLMTVALLFKSKRFKNAGKRNLGW
jgi:hypothetical protein